MARLPKWVQFSHLRLYRGSRWTAVKDGWRARGIRGYDRAESDEFGLYLTSGAQLANVKADICGNPDGLFVSYEALRTRRVVLVPARDGGYDELEGSPDMMLEILSRSSEEKDRVILRRAYWEADIHEYWLIDARQEPLKFDILRHTVNGSKATRKQDGWVKSAVFGKSFRLTQQPDALGHPEYTLEVR